MKAFKGGEGQERKRRKQKEKEKVRDKPQEMPVLGTCVLVWVLLSLPLRMLGRKEAEGLRG